MAIELHSLETAREALRGLWRTGQTIGSIHTLGALHDGHGRVIGRAAEENDVCVVSIYPNEAQLAPGARYSYDLELDTAFAFRHGATHVIAPRPGEMYGANYRTYLEQGCYQRLDGTVVPFLFRGMITMCIRWMTFVRPTRAYWGMKDIGQSILVKRAVDDLLMDCEVREVPCVRFRNGIPISSRLMSLPREKLDEVAAIYRALLEGMKVAASGERRAADVIGAVEQKLEQLRHFRVHYVKLVEPLDFTEPDRFSLPFILHCAVTDGKINHFDGFFVRTEKELAEGVATEWLDAEDPWEREERI